MLQHAHCCLNQHTAEGSCVSHCSQPVCATDSSEGSCVSHCSQPVCATDSSIISYSSLPSPSAPPLPHFLSFSSLSHLLFCPSPSSPPPPSPLLPSLFHPFPLHLPPLLLSLLLSLLLTLSSFVSSSPSLPHLSAVSLFKYHKTNAVLMSAFSFEIN